MLDNDLKEILKKNWGIKAECMECYCEIKFLDVFSNWACYVFALNPENESDIGCIIDHKGNIQIAQWTMEELLSHYNTEGEYPVIDDEFRRIKASELYRRLKNG